MGDWKPPGLQRIIAVGGSHYISLLKGEVNTVLKHPRINNKLHNFAGELQDAIQNTHKEGKIYETLGPHPYLVAYRGRTPYGIKLDHVRNGSLESYLETHNISKAEAHLFCLQLAKGAVFFHANRYIFCDFNARNVLVDDDLNLRFCDLQGELSDRDGNVIIKPRGIESPKSRWPNAGEDESSVKTDLFALGTTMYFVLHRQNPFPDLDEIADETQIKCRFIEGDLPTLPPTAVGRAICKCWTGAYGEAREVVKELEANEPASWRRLTRHCVLM